MKNYRDLYGTLVEGNFPHIKAINASSPTAKDGTPYHDAVVNDIWGSMQAIMLSAGLSPNGQSEAAGSSQILDALIKIIEEVSPPADKIEITRATLTKLGITQLSNAINSEDETLAATSRALNDLREHLTQMISDFPV